MAPPCTQTHIIYGTCGPADRGFDSHCWSCAEILGKPLILCTTCAYPAVMGTQWTRIVTEWLKLPASYMTWELILPGDIRLLEWCVLYTREGNQSAEYGTDIIKLNIFTFMCALYFKVLQFWASVQITEKEHK